MDQGQTPPEGVTFFIRWGLVEWGLSGMLSVGAAIAGWVWHLSDRVKELESQAKIDAKEKETMRSTIRTIGNALDRKIEAETSRLEERMNKVVEKMEEMREQLPSRQFIENQLMNLTERIDRSMDVKLAARD